MVIKILKDYSLFLISLLKMRGIINALLLVAMLHCEVYDKCYWEVNHNYSVIIVITIIHSLKYLFLLGNKTRNDHELACLVILCKSVVCIKI